MNRKFWWSSLAVTQPSTSHHILCERCVCVTALSGIYYSDLSWQQGNFVPITDDITGHGKFCNVTQTILNLFVPEICTFSNQQSPTVYNSWYSFTDLKWMGVLVWLSVPRVDPGTSSTVMHDWTFTRTPRELALESTELYIFMTRQIIYWQGAGSTNYY